jgi:serine phosphatase RsbU (regulator of sigma subunit)
VGQVTGGEAERRATERAVLVAAAREHSAAVARHLERVSDRLREHGRAAGQSNRELGEPLPRRHLPGPAAALAAALADLSRLLLADPSPEAAYASVLAVMCRSVESCDGSSVTVLCGDRVETAAATGDDVAATDRRQFAWRQGPCYEAATLERTCLARPPDPRWPVLDGGGSAGRWSAVLSVPLRSPAGALGAVNLYSREPGAFVDTEVTVAELVAEHAAAALASADAVHAQQALARSLQRSLLPPSLPQVPGLAFAAGYRPASAGINVGGDWYDVLRLPEGRLVLIIGDVAGHGLAAAMTMAQLRTAVRAFALEGHDPVEVLTLVDRFLQHVEPDGYATCCIVALNPATGEIRWGNAGHPDPLVLLPDGRSGWLTDGGRLAALGVPAASAPVHAGITVLPPGARLLLFTDGLVERRRESLEEGLDRLARAAAVPGTGLQPWCDEVVASQLDDREVGDDVAVLAVELAGRPPGLADPDSLLRVPG